MLDATLGPGAEFFKTVLSVRDLPDCTNETGTPFVTVNAVSQT
jgi:hypothetical protein